jgi:hypothetical protein
LKGNTMDKSVKGLQELPPAVAGAGSKVDVKKPVYRNASGYKVAEDVNSGLPGGKAGKAGEFGGQTEDNWAAEKNKLVGQSDYQKDPYRARGGDFPVQHVDARSGQSGMHGFSEGHDELATQSINVEGVRHAEDDGPMTPVPSDRSRLVAAAHPIEQSKGESSSTTGFIPIPQMVDLQTGHIVGGETGVNDYVPQFNVSQGKPPARNMKSGYVGQKR